MSEHPFLEQRLDIAWSRLGVDRIVPDVELALGRARAAIGRLEQPVAAGEALTYETVLAAFEDAADDLQFAWGIVGHLQSVLDSPALREAHAKLLPAVSEFYSAIPLNEGVWARLQAYAETEDARSLTGARRRFLEETLADFRQYGAGLPKEKKERLLAIDAELAEVTKRYSENVLDSRNAWELTVEDPARLRGLPETAASLALQSARSKGLGTDARPVWRFTLQQPSVVAVLTHLDDEDLRRTVWEANSRIASRDPWNNEPLVIRILELRREKAELLGKRHFPDLVLERRMAGSGARALEFIEDLHRRTLPGFQREVQELEAFKARRTGGQPGPLAPWEIAYWAEKLRQEKYDFDDEQLRPYFPINQVIKGLFEITGRLFGIEVREVTGVEVWHPDVKFYELRETGGRHLGSFYADWHPRESKRGGAWMGYLLTGGPGKEAFRPHLGYICGNLTPASEGRPALLSHDDVITVFHEFGHLLHHLLGEVEVRSLNGVNVAWDFVELPSQILENWCWERESLDLFARHWETGAVIPEDLFQRMRAARTFRAASGMMRQLSFGKLDLELHLREPGWAAGDLDEKVRGLLRDYLIPTSHPSPAFVRNFGHLFSSPVGYAGGYYSYKWAEVLDADAFGRFRREGILNSETGLSFRREVLSRGNSEEPAELFRRFMGRDPDPIALLERSGLAA
jgi:oligopeptidase A